MKGAKQLKQINNQTEILGLVGYPLGHSFSPLLHNSASARLNLNYLYLSLQVEPDQLEEAVNGIRALGIKGVNVTIPYKEKVIPLLDRLDPLAEEIGAVNTIINQQGVLAGYNTDGSGFYRMLKEDGNFKIKGKKAVMVGAGGAARAVGTVLCQYGLAELMVINRTTTRAARLTANLQQRYPRTVFKTTALAEENTYLPFIERADLVVDTTPIGTFPHQQTETVIQLPADLSSKLVIDLVYNPPLTVLLQEAADRGAETLNGLDMLIYQAADAFKLWTGKEPDLAHWRQILQQV